MKRTTALTGALILALGAASLPALAQQGPGDGPRTPRGPMFQFEDVDADGDGKITQEEMAAQAAARFAAADANGDGQLSAEEMQAQMQAQRAERMKQNAERMIARRDTNKDGMLSAEEMAPRNSDRMFARLDADKDGAISKQEMEQARERFQKRDGDHGKRFGDHRKGERGEHGDRWMKHRNDN